MEVCNLALRLQAADAPRITVLLEGIAREVDELHPFRLWAGEVAEKIIQRAGASSRLTLPQAALIARLFEAAYNSIDNEKNSLLTTVMLRAVEASEISLGKATAVGRAINLCSGAELRFLQQVGLNWIQLGFLQTNTAGAIAFQSKGVEEDLVCGLLSLGLFVAGGPVVNEIGLYRCSSIGATVLELLNPQ